MKGTSPTSAGNAPSNPHLFSVIPYILILLLFRKTTFPLSPPSAVYRKIARATVFRPVSLLCPASRHKHSICSGPVMLFLSFKFLIETEIIRILIHQSVPRITLVHDMKQGHPVIVIHALEQAKPLLIVRQPGIILPRE